MANEFGPFSNSAKVFKASFWMCFYHSKSPKRTYLWSNSPFIEKLHMSISKAAKDFMVQSNYSPHRGSSCLAYFPECENGTP